VPTLIESAGRPSIEERSAAIKALGEYGREAQTAVPILIELCKDGALLPVPPDPDAKPKIRRRRPSVFSPIGIFPGALDPLTGIPLFTATVGDLAKWALGRIAPERMGQKSGKEEGKGR
jgi:hypothetical protein